MSTLAMCISAIQINSVKTVVIVEGKQFFLVINVYFSYLLNVFSFCSHMHM